MFALKAAAAAVRALAAIAGLFAGRHDGIVLISCQGNEPSQDIMDLAEALRALPDAPYVYVTAGRMRRSAGGAFSFLVRMFSMLRQISGARVVVIDAYCPAVSIPKKRPGQKVVQLWHAPEAIKKFSLQIVDTPAGYSNKTTKILRMHKGYDYILCPSSATRPFFSESFGYPESAFVKFGLPSLDRIGRLRRPAAGETEDPERAAARSAIYRKYPALAGEGRRPLTVVFAPAFRDGAPVDAEGLVRAFSEALTAAEPKGLAGEDTDAKGQPDITLVLKLHPLDALTLGRFETAGINLISDKEFPLINWYAAADVIVTDYSGVVVEAAAAGVASYYYIYDMDDFAARRGINVDLREEATGKYAFIDAAALAAQMIHDFTGNFSYDYDALAAFARKYLEVPLFDNTKRLAAFISECRVC